MILGFLCRIPGADDGFAALFFGGEGEVEGEEFFEEVVGGAKAVGLQHEGIELFVEFVELAGGFVKVGVVEFGDAPLFLLHLFAAVLVEFEGFVADFLDDSRGGGLGEGKGFEAGIVGVASVAFQGRTLSFYPNTVYVGC